MMESQFAPWASWEVWSFRLLMVLLDQEGLVREVAETRVIRMKPECMWPEK